MYAVEPIGSNFNFGCFVPSNEVSSQGRILGAKRRRLVLNPGGWVPTESKIKRLDSEEGDCAADCAAEINQPRNAA